MSEAWDPIGALEKPAEAILSTIGHARAKMAQIFDGGLSGENEVAEGARALARAEAREAYLEEAEDA